MSKTSFNGPFRISGDADGWRASHDGIGCSEYRAIKDAGDFVVALVVDANEDHTAQLDTKRHADLFAAAPLMLDALKDAEHRMRSQLILLKCDDEFIARETETVRAAIAAATGENNG